MYACVYENIFVSFVSRWWTPKRSICVWEIAHNSVLVKEYGDVYSLMACNDPTWHATHFLPLFCGEIACRTRWILGHLSHWEMLMANMPVHSLRKTDFKWEQIGHLLLANQFSFLFLINGYFLLFCTFTKSYRVKTCSYWQISRIFSRHLN